MKKLFLSFIALVSAMTMSAQTTADVTLRLESESGSVSEMYLFAGPDLVTTPERGSFMVNASNPEDINIYAVDPTTNGKYSSYGNGTLVNIPVEIITSKEVAAKQNYTIKFEVFEDAEVLKLKDLVTGAETDIVNGDSYNFSVTAGNAPSYVEGSYSVIANRFVINYVAPVTTVTTNAYGFASFSYTEDLKLATAGAKLYTGAISGEALDMTEVDYVKAGEGVIVKGAANTTYNLVEGTGTSVYGVNALIASANWTAATEDAYFLVGNEFKKYTGTEAVPAGKAYLIYTTTGGANPAPARIVMRFNTTTAVENVEEEAVQPVKFIENGEIFIRRGNEVYNLQGQLVK